MSGFHPRFKYDLIISYLLPHQLFAHFLCIDYVSYFVCVALFWVDDDVSAADTFILEITAFVPGHELPGKVLLTGYTAVWFSSLPFDLCYPS